MFNLIVKGLGGEGAKTAVEILAKAANKENKFFLAYPEFGPERSGTPINAYFKMDDKLIRDRSPIKIADYILILNKNLERIDSELKKGGTLIINSEIHKKYYYLNAKEISPIPNIAMLGALIRITKILKKESVESVLPEEFLKEFQEGYKMVKNGK